MESFEDTLKERMNGILQLDGIQQAVEQQFHLDEGSNERIYWHYGYAAALKDVLALLDKSNKQLN